MGVCAEQGIQTFNPSNMDADVSTRGPAATFDVFARVATYFFSHGFTAAFFQDYSVFMSNFSTL
jgi:hypothetical protein